MCASTRVSYLRVVRPLARLDELLDVDAGELQTLALVDEARELDEAAAVVVGLVCVLQRSAIRSRLYVRVQGVFIYALVLVWADTYRRTFRQS